MKRNGMRWEEELSKKEKWERNGGFNYHIYGNELANLRNWNGIVTVREKMEIQ